MFIPGKFCSLQSTQSCVQFAFYFKVEVRYNLPSTRGEICKFDLNTKVREVKEENAGDLFGPVQDDDVEEEQPKKPGEKKDDKKRGGKKGKGCKKLKNKAEKRRCRKKEREEKEKDKNKDKKKPPPKHQPVKSIHLKACTR